ncbi:MAG TPA: hypothetical protein VGX96_13145 [Candidatus Elarobacter sp.]|jgi:hypothetical protein|nr:hypothetical protein [Candidatus Elarobacter sp.]
MNARLFGAIAIAIALLPIVARAEQGAIRNIPASHITISRVHLHETSLIGQSGECVAFTNTSPVDAYRVLFLFSLIDIDGRVLHSDMHEAKGRFSTGALVQGENETTCRHGTFGVRGGSVYGEGKIGSMVASVAQVDYVDGTSWYAASAVPGASLAQADAGVRITQSFSWEPADATQECVSFTNAGSRTVQRVRFMFSHIADDGTDIVDDPWDVRGTYPPGTSRSNSCRGWNGSLKPRSDARPDAAVPLELLVFGKPARLVTWISVIDYADGTSWRAAPQQPGALAAAAIPNKIDYSHAVFGPPTPDIAGSFLQRPASGIEITKSFAWNPGTPNECVKFINKSVKAVKRVRFVFSHLGGDDAPLGPDEPVDFRPRSGSYDPGVSQERICRAFVGTVMLPSYWNGGSTEPQAFVDSRPATLTVRVDEVDYADGSSWTAAASH